MRDHMLICDNIVSFEGFSVLADGTNGFRIKLQESLLICRDRTQLNKKTSELAPLMYSLKMYPICSFTLLYSSSDPLDN